MARRKLSAEINVVPYIDVMLVLLIIFMITAPLITQGVDVELPKTDSQPIPTPQEPLILSVDAQGRFFLNKGDDKDQAVDEKELISRITSTLQKAPDTMVLVQGDTKVSYGEVAHAMTLLQQAGIKKIGFITQPQDAQTH
ncbi:protein TolR [Stenotrophobium rhamnosiphilum]|uniref:Tol-Pal system protein TolR n=1 Tax=Stenotrophobium rhamnosiphilum TaxID=2029166 RepID=A0A2T5MH87_9GAMM|nr:protein TolR [Stenotrophobium rhamnosiphilum]PTU31951.1 protein TolR [Stenotrophobium rhamnosiphilum]